MAKRTPKNPLTALLVRLGLQQADVFHAAKGELDRGRLSILCREIPSEPGQPQPSAPTDDTRSLLDRIVRELRPESGGLPAEAWNPFVKALADVRKPHDRRRRKPVEHAA